jgi:hypothetical protein
MRRFFMTIARTRKVEPSDASQEREPDIATALPEVKFEMIGETQATAAFLNGDRAAFSLEVVTEDHEGNHECRRGTLPDFEARIAGVIKKHEHDTDFAKTLSHFSAESGIAGYSPAG